MAKPVCQKITVYLNSRWAYFKISIYNSILIRLFRFDFQTKKNCSFCTNQSRDSSCYRSRTRTCRSSLLVVSLPILQVDWSDTSSEVDLIRSLVVMSPALNGSTVLCTTYLVRSRLVNAHTTIGTVID